MGAQFKAKKTATTTRNERLAAAAAAQGGAKMGRPQRKRAARATGEAPPRFGLASSSGRRQLEANQQAPLSRYRSFKCRRRARTAEASNFGAEIRRSGQLAPIGHEPMVCLVATIAQLIIIIAHLNVGFGQCSAMGAEAAVPALAAPAAATATTKAEANNWQARVSSPQLEPALRSGVVPLDAATFATPGK